MKDPRLPPRVFIHFSDSVSETVSDGYTIMSTVTSLGTSSPVKLKEHQLAVSGSVGDDCRGGFLLGLNRRRIAEPASYSMIDRRTNLFGRLDPRSDLPLFLTGFHFHYIRIHIHHLKSSFLYGEIQKTPQTDGLWRRIKKHHRPMTTCGVCFNSHGVWVKTPRPEVVDPLCHFWTHEPLPQRLQSPFGWM